MPSRLVPSRKISRARSISNRNVLEFTIVKENPLIAFCLIQGTAREPYTVIINLEEKYVAHWCPDFAKSRRSSSYRYKEEGI